MIIAFKRPRTIAEIKDERKEISERIEEAADTLKRLPNRERRSLLCARSNWPTMILQRWEHGAHEGIKLIGRPIPTGQQIDRCDEVMDWLLALAKTDRRFCSVVWLMCGERRPASYVAKLIKHDPKTARRWMNNGLDQIIRIREGRMAA